MNMIMDSGHHPHPHPDPHAAQTTPPTSPQQRAELHITTSTPSTSPNLHAIHHHSNIHISNNNNNNSISNNNNNNPDTQISPVTVPASVVSGKSTLKRSFDVAFLMMPDERVKQKQQLAEKQARLAESIAERHQYPTDLSPRCQQQQQHHHHHQQQLHHQLLQDPSMPVDLFSLHEARRYSQISARSPRIYDDPTVVIPAAAAAAAAVAAVVADSHDSQSPPMRSAFTKVTAATRLESPNPPPPLSPGQLSCSSMSPPVATTPPRTNSGNGSLSNGSSSSAPACLNSNIVYQNFRPVEYQFNGAFQSVNQVHVLHAHRLKQQLMYRPQLNGGPMSVVTSSGGGGGGGGASVATVTTSAPPSDFLPAYAGFPFPAAAAAAAAASPFAAAAAVASPELPRIVQNPAAAAILSTLIPPTLASTFSLTAQNVCAKCNISFRMTSDLVYHMRSHHKSEVACDPNRRKREEKLKCPVCQESFRERHHLTRHMTAHQDKESDQVVPNASGGDSCGNNSSVHNGGTTTRHYGPTRLTGSSAPGAPK